MTAVEDDAHSVDVASDVVTPAAAGALHGFLDAPGPNPQSGDAVPPLWHWLAFLPRVPQRAIGRDGHPLRTSETRPEEFPQRMFAGGRIRYAGQARIGQVLTRASRTLSLEEKSGRSGKLLIATHEYVIDGDGQTVIDELQNIVYRAPSARSSSDLGAHRSGGMNNFEWSLDVRIDAVTLFRFSALTYNAHRIHYDLDYAQTIEAYPGLVVQGPLQAMWLAELCRRNAPFETVESFEFRAVRPMFEGGELHLRGRKVGATANLAAFDQHGQQTVEAKVEFLPS